MASMKDMVTGLEERRAKLQPGGDPDAIEKQHNRGKLTAWERIGLLFDPGTFQEIGIWTQPMKTGFDIDKAEVPRDAMIAG